MKEKHLLFFPTDITCTPFCFFYTYLVSTLESLQLEPCLVEISPRNKPFPSAEALNTRYSSEDFILTYLLSAYTQYLNALYLYVIASVNTNTCTVHPGYRYTVNHNITSNTPIYVQLKATYNRHVTDKALIFSTVSVNQQQLSHQCQVTNARAIEAIVVASKYLPFDSFDV